MTCCRRAHQRLEYDPWRLEYDLQIGRSKSSSTKNSARTQVSSLLPSFVFGAMIMAVPTHAFKQEGLVSNSPFTAYTITVRQCFQLHPKTWNQAHGR